MLRKLLLLTLGVSLFVACKKEESYEPPVNGGSYKLEGNYEFAGIEVDVTTTDITSYAGSSAKSIAHTYYISKANTGTVKIDSKKMDFTGIGYEIDTTIKVDSYTDNVFEESFDFDFAYVAPPSNSTGPYTLKGADSIISNSSGYALTSTGSAIATGPSSSKYYWSNDTLIFRSKMDFSYRQSMGQGVTLSVSHQGITLMKLKRAK